MMNIQKAVIARAKMCETDLDRVTIVNTTDIFQFLAFLLLHILDLFSLV